MGKDRRSFLQSVGATALLSTLPGEALADNSDPTATHLGSFDDGTNGWEPAEGNELGRVESDSMSGYLDGSHGLAVGTKIDNQAMITNSQDVREFDLTGSSHLVTDVIPAVGGADSNVTFQFAIHYTSGDDVASPSDGATDGGSTDSEVVTSPTKSVPQYQKCVVSWDLGTVDANVKRNARRLDIRWTPSDDASNANRPVENRMYTIFDDVRLIRDITEINVQELNQTVTNLRLDHGALESVDVREEQDDLERGEFVFNDGTTVTYVLEEVGEDKYRYTLGDEEYKLGGGWE